MATLTRTSLAHSDVNDTHRDLRLGIPSPFPSNALVREEDELLDSLADEELQLDDGPGLQPSPAELEEQNGEVNHEGVAHGSRSAVSVPA